MKWFDDEREHSPFLMALAEGGHLSTREGWRCQHVQANIVSIDQYAEAATGDREFFLNEPHSLTGGAGEIPIVVILTTLLVDGTSTGD